MKKTALAVLALGACGPGPAPAPFVDVTIYWEFDRNTFIDGVIGIVPYDTIVNWPPNTGSRACPESGVDFVTVADAFGNPLTSFVPCINQSVQGVVVPGFAGNNTYVVTGWNNASGFPWYRGSVTVNAVPGAFNFGTAIAAGLEGIARNPSAQNKIFIPMIVGLALIESLVIYALVISLMIVLKL